MVLRNELSCFLADLYRYENFQDKCENGLQVEGKETINRIVFGVSFNLPFLKQALEKKPDAIIVHHGIFQQGVFKLTGTLKQKVKMLLDNGISLYGIHLPMDAHPEIGHAALLLSASGAEELEPFDVGSKGKNAEGHTLDRLLEIFHTQLHTVNTENTEHTESFDATREPENPIFSLSTKFGFRVLRNGPEIPKHMVVMTGGSSDFYEKAIKNGVDTFFGGDIKEKTPALSLETQTNFINLGHYYSEKPGVLALEKLLAEKFALRTDYIEIPNPV